MLLIQNRTIVLLLAALSLLTASVSPIESRAHVLGNGVALHEISWDGRSFAAVSLDLKAAELQLFWKGPDGKRIGSFERLRAQLETSGKHLVFATNAGIFEPNFTPTGLFVENGRELVPLNRRDGTGNFYLKPNGILIVDHHARVIETSKYAGTTPDIRRATQSGPLLVQDGSINAAFDPRSHNTRVRSGVGVSDADHVWFVLSREPVTFFQVATLFRQKLNCPNALYLDGAISRFYPPVEVSGGVNSQFAGILAIRSDK